MAKSRSSDDLVALTDTGNPSLTARQSEFAPGTGLSDSAYVEVADELGKVLADSFQLFIKTQGVHWNVAGAAFYGLHKLTEQQYGEIYAAIDEIAERIRALGQKTPASLATYARLSSISDEDRPNDTGQQVAMLMRDNGLVCQTLRDALDVAEAHDDIVTVDLLTRRLGDHEKYVWMLRMQIA
ncbi:Dps family protein [Sandarakinorhabdus oryzae]|uniref:Dps family protein n=1 Tax=Sandarakinorhabdus oryzae TaxID=2675220 RepID=UPI0012E25E09|nr:DNA starvation/stationary phase protection protein [Sandarakinorhabdus oryzae]